ncbi:Fanconi-associated nuclease 1-like protein [Forsythia ovata]|uniref:Fanconi-associated nuclease n=1 Tax=Forsythia ovata TaxID=205694 RepID=A0ABD1P7I3_9LAMI
MLKGRQSLIRLIGKRRRFLPNRHYVISSSSTTPRNCSSLCKKDDSETKDLVEKSQGSGSMESVNCPVCGAQLPGQDNGLINSHLDECLARGKKRKLSQRTFLQLNFLTPKVKFHSIQPDDIGNQVIVTDPAKDNVCDTIHNSNTSDDFEEGDNNQNDSSMDSVALQSDRLASCRDSPIVDDSINNKSHSLPLPLENVMPNYVMEKPVEDFDISKVFLQTFIVGRKFSTVEELDPGAMIRLSRDPENVKDPNAVKVLYADCAYDNVLVLGYLPRELAQYLSPLIEMFNLSFEGYITFIPKDSRAVVPIQIVCKDELSCNEKYRDNVQVFNSLWQHALRVVELAKTSPLGMTRYQHNLVLLIQDVLKSNPHLFTIGEKSFLEAFDSLSDDSQRLFARLYTRKGPWFRMSNISYPEISDCNQAIKGLSETGYICFFSLRDDDLEEVLNVLNIDELREALRMLNKKFKHGTRKQETIDLLLSSCHYGSSSRLASFILSKTGACVRISALAESLIWRAERLFFLNGEQDVSSFLLVDLGIVKYPSYNCILSEQIFPNRSDLLAYEEAIEIAQIMDESLDDNNFELVLKCIEISDSRLSISVEKSRSLAGGTVVTFLSCFSVSWVYSKVVLLGVSFLEREKRYGDAINLLKRLLHNFLSDGRRGYWTLRLSVDLEHLGCLDESLRFAEDGLHDPWVRAGSRVSLQKRVLRLGRPPRRWKIPSYSKSVNRNIPEVHVQGRPLNSKPGMKSIFYGEDGEQCGVEQLALQYYAGEGGGWRGVHTESGIWLTIFGILMWDIFFADVPNVFCTKFQTAPLDLEFDSFYEARKSLIESLLDKIQDGLAEEILITSWELHAGTACRGVHWEKHTLSELREAVTCIGGHCLASICRHLAQGYRSWSSGMPDLLLWRLHDNYRGEAKLVEVKGPRDRLSEQQHAWLLVLMDCDFNVELDINAGEVIFSAEKLWTQSRLKMQRSVVFLALKPFGSNRSPSFSI